MSSTDRATAIKSLDHVQPATINQFAVAPPRLDRLYNQLLSQNESLAVWLRKRAIELCPDIESREATSQLALELIGIINNQATIDRLRDLLVAKS